MRLVLARVYWATCFGFLAVLLAVAPAAAVVGYDYPNVLGARADRNWGARASIQTSEPTSRYHPGGDWIYHRVLSRRRVPTRSLKSDG